MRIAVIGGGSTYTPELVEGLAFWQLRGGPKTVCLFDVNQAHLQVVGAFSQKLAQTMNSDLQVELCDQFDEAVANADFVLFQIRVGGQRARHEDTKMALSEGVVGQETVGVGGLAMCLRTIPPILDMARRVRDKNPSAWIINLTNPTGMVTEAISRFATTRCVGLCNIPREFQMDMARHLRVEPERVELDWVGLNHLGWCRSIRVDGHDRLPGVIDSMVKSYGPRLTRGLDFPVSLLQALRMIPSSFLGYYYMPEQMYQDLAGRPRTRAEDVIDIEQDLLEYYRDTKNELKPVSLSERGGTWSSRIAVELMEALTKEKPQRFIVDTLNMGTVNGLPGDSCIESAATISKDSVKPLAVGDLPESIAGLVRQVKSYERLTLEAAISQDETKALVALLNNPLVPTALHAQKLMKHLKRRGLI